MLQFLVFVCFFLLICCKFKILHSLTASSGDGAVIVAAAAAVVVVCNFSSFFTYIFFMLTTSIVQTIKYYLFFLNVRNKKTDTLIKTIQCVLFLFSIGILVKLVTNNYRIFVFNNLFIHLFIFVNSLREYTRCLEICYTLHHQHKC